MKIILDATEVYDHFGSPYRYFKGIIPRLSQYPDLNLEVLKSPADDSKNGTQRATWFPQGKLRSWLGNKRKSLAKRWRVSKIASEEPTLFHTYYYTLSPIENVPLVSFYHDIIAEIFQKEFPSRELDDLIRRKEKSVRASVRLLANSETTKKDLCGLYGISPDKVDVTYFGIEYDFFAEAQDASAASVFRRKYSLPERYFFYVGARVEHKNFTRFAEAYARLGARTDYALVVAGHPWNAAEVLLLKKLGITAHHIKYPDQPDLRMLYQLARLHVYPSLYEGFGAPPLEAMASGVPVVAARAGAIPEVSGDAAEYFDPLDSDSMVHAIERVLEPRRSEELVQLGRIQARKFSWEDTAARTVAAYRKIFP